MRGECGYDPVNKKVACIVQGLRHLVHGLDYRTRTFNIPSLVGAFELRRFYPLRHASLDASGK